VRRRSVWREVDGRGQETTCAATETTGGKTVIQGRNNTGGGRGEGRDAAHPHLVPKRRSGAELEPSSASSTTRLAGGHENRECRSEVCRAHERHTGCKEEDHEALAGEQRCCWRQGRRGDGAREPDPALATASRSGGTARVSRWVMVVGPSRRKGRPRTRRMSPLNQRKFRVRSTGTRRHARGYLDG
jgi:hypothetical protein